MKHKNILTVASAFLKVGTIGFGGGTALIPVIEDELVEKNKWIDAEAFDRAVAVSSVSPASVPVALCSIWDGGYSLLSAYAYALPGSLIYLLLLTGFSLTGESGLKYIGYASVGLISFVLFVLFRFIKKNFIKYMRSGNVKPYLITIAASFLLTCGNAFKRLFMTLLRFPAGGWPASVYSVGMINLMFIAIFMSCFIGSSRSKLKIGAAVAVAVIYASSFGNFGVNEWPRQIGVGMAVLATASAIYDAVIKKKMTRDTKRREFRFDRASLINLVLFILLSIIFITAAYFLSGNLDVWDFSGRVVSSSLTSFGGGEVYYAVSESVFVDSGFTSRVFYDSHIAGVAGAMPGPVLVAIASGIGYGFGESFGGVGYGWMFGLLGFSLAVAATAVGALSLYIFFDALNDSVRIQTIIRYIIPIVCGMLISTALSLASQASLTLAVEGIHPVVSLGIVVSIFLLLTYINKKYRIRDVILLLLCGFGTLAALGALNYFSI